MLEDSNMARECERVNAHGWTCFHVAAYALQLECIRVAVRRVGFRSPLIHALTGDLQTSIHLAIQVVQSAKCICMYVSNLVWLYARKRSA